MKKNNKKLLLSLSAATLGVSTFVTVGSLISCSQSDEIQLIADNTTLDFSTTSCSIMAQITGSLKVDDLVWSYTSSSTDLPIEFIGIKGSNKANLSIKSGQEITNDGTVEIKATIGSFSKTITINIINSKIYSLDGTNWVGYISGSLVCEIIPGTNVCMIKTNNSYKAHNLVIPPAVEIDGQIYNLITVGGRLFLESTDLSGSLTIGENIVTIEEGAFMGCINLNGALIFNKKIQEIHFGAFGSSNFTGDLIIPDTVTTIGEMAFARCSSFTGKLVINKSIKTLAADVFNGCGFTGKLDIPDNITKIGKGAFAECSGFIGDLIIPNNVTIIEPSAFQECKGLNGKVIIGKNVATMGDNVFSRCANLKEVIIPSSITSIGASCFNYCPVLNSIIFDGWNEMPSWSTQNIFYLDFAAKTGTIKSINGTWTSELALAYAIEKGLPNTWIAS